jgi:hypothetical protein
VQGADAPPGYHHEDRIRLAPLIGGVVTSAIGVGFVGIGMNEQLRSHGIDDPDYSTLLYVEGGIHLAIGVPLILLGVFGREHVFVRNDVALDVTPIVGTRSAAVSVRLAF